MDTTPPAHSERRDSLSTVAEMALNLVPGVGGPLAVALKHRLNANLQRRQETWLGELATGLEDLRQRFEGFDPDKLADDDVFVDAVLTASRMAARNSQREKLDALRNAVLNAALPGSPDEDEQQRLFALIDDLTPTHLRLLALLNDPPAWFERTGRVRPQFALSSNRTAMIKAAMPEIVARGEGALPRFYGDLERWGLLSGSLGGMMSADAAFNAVTNDYAGTFLAFVQDPRSGDLPAS